MTAEITKISKNDPAYSKMRHKYAQFNGTYKYDYQGVTYTGNDRIAGANTSIHMDKVGDHVTIHIDPNSPKDLYDRFAANALRSALLNGGMILFAGLLLIFGPFIIR
ncbi:MAG: hypothetical protein IJ071_01285 [Ruminococcus sp.]|nr:hypothetical protein [Ruminococcus sp.]